MNAGSLTPAHVTIEPRNLRFTEVPRSQVRHALAQDWAGGSPFITAIYNALSMTFPLGEQFFIDNVRYYAERIDDHKLRREIGAFCAQEGFHRREHQSYNEVMCRVRGYDHDRLEAPLRNHMEFISARVSRRRLLAATVACEHITAIFAREILTNPEWTANMPPAMRQLWLWHALEETEHKSVAFDVYRAIGGDEKMRRRALIVTSVHLVTTVLRMAFAMLRHDGQLWRWRTWRDCWQFLLGKHSFLRAVRRNWQAYFRAGFHPWQQPDGIDLDRVRAMFAEAA
jgi:predicted metal-dependent hydrolase